MVLQTEITLPEYPRGYHIIDEYIDKAINDLGKLPNTGIVNLFIQHSSAALSINENADPSVRDDFESIINKLIPEKQAIYTHIYEGDDDMPAHIKSSLFGSTISIPISNSRLNLGIWQGIYLCEFRNNGGNRNIVITVMG